MRKMLTCLIALFPAMACAKVTADNAWIRSSTGPNGALFIELANDSPQLDALVEAKTTETQCDHMELHTHIHEDGKVMMRQVASIDVPGAGKAELKPGGLHVMLMGLKKPLEAGQVIPVSLTFESGEVLDLKVPVKSASGGHSH